MEPRQLLVSCSNAAAEPGTVPLATVRPDRYRSDRYRQPDRNR
ncbi:hypothetical protein [Streptomyces sp. NPDC055709]